MSVRKEGTPITTELAGTLDERITAERERLEDGGNFVVEAQKYEVDGEIRCLIFYVSSLETNFDPTWNYEVRHPSSAGLPIVIQHSESITYDPALDPFLRENDIEKQRELGIFQFGTQTSFVR